MISQCPLQRRSIILIKKSNLRLCTGSLFSPSVFSNFVKRLAKEVFYELKEDFYDSQEQKMREEHIGPYTLEKVFNCRRSWDQTCIQVSNSLIGSDLDEK